MRTTNKIRVHIRKIYGQEYSRSGYIRLLHRRGFTKMMPGNEFRAQTVARSLGDRGII